MKKQADKYYTPKEYLAVEEAAEYKSEYYQGNIFAMSGGSVNHNRIVGNLHAGLLPKLAGGHCEAFMSDMRVWIEAKGVFTYPDITIVCGDLQFYESRKILTNQVPGREEKFDFGFCGLGSV
jgi:Uma2 family endonuclease